VASNHYHLLIRVPDAERMADFMGYFQTNAAREVGRLRKWRDKIWSRRYEAIVISDEPAAQVDRLRYVLANGVKEGLVARVEDWPGISLVKSVLSGEPVRGTWFNRTAEYRARLRGKDFEPRRYATEETVVLSQLPCWRHLSPEVYRELIAGLVQEIDADGAAEQKRTGRKPLASRPSCSNTRTPVRTRRRSHPRRASSRPARQPARPFGRPTASSLRPSAKRRRGSKPAIERRDSPTAAFRRAYPTSVCERPHRGRR